MAQLAEPKSTREKNALTIMPLPVRIPAAWYDLLPKVLPLISRTQVQTKSCIADETAQIFLKRWQQALIRREGSFVWLHLGGVACYEVLPDFVKTVREKIEQRDKELKNNRGVKALIQHWRNCVEELKQLDDNAVLKHREDILRLLQPEMWQEGLGRAWSFAAERAELNFNRIRPAVQRWIYKYEKRCDLDKPFGGILSRSPALRRASPPPHAPAKK